MSVFIKIRRLVMKKLLASMLCLALAGSVVLSSCGKKDEKKENVIENQQTVVEEQEIVQEVVEIQVPEQQLDFEFEIDSFDMEAKITQYLGDATEVVIPDTITDPVYGDVVPVTKIGTYAFGENEAIEAVVLPETVTVIQKGAFQSCPNLRAVSLPNGLTTIEEKAFYNSNKIEKLGMVIDNESEQEASLFDKIGNEFPATVTEIGFMAFSSQLNEIAWYSALEGDVVVIGDGILLKFNGEEDYTMDEGIKSIAYYAFSNVGPIRITVTNTDVQFDENSIFMCDKEFTFVVPEEATELASTIKSCGAAYELLVPEAAEGEEVTSVEVAE